MWSMKMWINKRLHEWVQWIIEGIFWWGTMKAVGFIWGRWYWLYWKYGWWLHKRVIQNFTPNLTPAQNSLLQPTVRPAVFWSLFCRFYLTVKKSFVIGTMLSYKYKKIKHSMFYFLTLIIILNYCWGKKKVICKQVILCRVYVNCTFPASSFRTKHKNRQFGFKRNDRELLFTLFYLRSNMINILLLYLLLV